MINEISIQGNESFSKDKDRVVFFDYKASVSEMFLMHVYVISRGDLRNETKLKDLIGSFVKLKLSFGTSSKISEQFFSGIISSATYVVLGGEKILDTKEKIVLKLEIRPALYLLKFNKNFRSFPNQSNDKVIKAIFDDFNKKYKDFDFELKFVKSHFMDRLNINQMGESDFDFLMRLMNSEGISFYFKQEETGHKIILTDDIVSHFKSEKQDKEAKTYYLVQPSEPYKLFSGYKSYLNKSHVMVAGADSVFVNYHHDMKLALKGYELTGWDFRDSQSLRQNALEVSSVDNNLATVQADLKEKVFQQSLQNTSTSNLEDTIATRQSLIHSLSEYTDANVISGQSSLAQSYFPILGDYIEVKCSNDYDESKDFSFYMEKDKTYYLCDVFYIYQDPSFFDKVHGASLHKQLFIFDFKAINSTGMFLKLPNKKNSRRVPNALSAKVYGKDKVHLLNDKDLMVKVMFPWHSDFNNPTDGSDSSTSADSESLDAKGDTYSWARVAQPWVGTAGGDSGSVILPRPGNEVYLIFQDDDNEWPIIVGCGYNSKEKIPVTLTNSEELGDIKVCFPPKSSSTDQNAGAGSDSDKSLVGQAKLSRVGKDDSFTFKGNYFVQEFDEKIDIVTNELSITVGNKDKECVMITVTPKGFELHQVGNNLSVSIHDDKENKLSLGEDFSSVCQGEYKVDAKGNLTFTTPKNQEVEAEEINLTYKSELKGGGKSIELGYTGGSVKGG